MIKSEIQGGIIVRKSVRIAAVLVGVLSMVIASICSAAHPDIPRIPVDELKKLIDAKATVIILDAQLKEIYAKGHIKGAISFPWKAEVTEEDVAKFAKDALIVTYCDCGPGEADSSDLASQLLNLGFSNVKVLGDPSIRGWIKSGYPME